jgi:hypothetical protein
VCSKSVYPIHYVNIILIFKLSRPRSLVLVGTSTGTSFNLSGEFQSRNPVVDNGSALALVGSRRYFNRETRDPVVS